MKKDILFLVLIVALLCSCSSIEKAFTKDDPVYTKDMYEYFLFQMSNDETIEKSDGEFDRETFVIYWNELNSEIRELDSLIDDSYLYLNDDIRENPFAYSPQKRGRDTYYKTLIEVERVDVRSVLAKGWILDAHEEYRLTFRCQQDTQTAGIVNSNGTVQYAYDYYELIYNGESYERITLVQNKYRFVNPNRNKWVSEKNELEKERERVSKFNVEYVFSKKGYQAWVSDMYSMESE